MSELEDQLQAFVDHVKSISSDLSASEKAEITKAGADVLKSALHDAARSRHYTNRRTGKKVHLADSPIAENLDADGERNGNSTVGFDKQHAAIARWLNDGTKFITGDHWVDNVRAAVKDDMARAEFEKYQEIVDRKKG